MLSKRLFLKTSLPPWYWYLFVLVLLLGAFLRFYDLGAESFWLDEVFSARIVAMPIGQIIDLIPPDKPPLDYYAQAILSGLGEPEFSHRLPAAIAGFLLLPGAFILGGRLLGRNLALPTMLVAAVNPMLVFYSREARPYSLFACLLIWQLVFFFAWWRDRRAGRRAIVPMVMTGVISLAMMYTLYASLISFFCEIVYTICMVLVERRRARRHLITTGLLLGLLTAVVLLSIPLRGRAELYVSEDYFFRFEGLSFHLYVNLLESFFLYCAPFSMDFKVALVGFALALIGVVWIVKRQKSAGLFLLIATLPPLLLFPLLYDHINRSFHPRYAIFCVPPFLLLYAAGIGAIAHFFLDKRVRRVVFWTLLFLYSVAGIYTSMIGRPYRKDWRSAIQYLTDESKPGDIVVVPGTLEYIVVDYYLDRLAGGTRNLVQQDSFVEPEPDQDVWMIDVEYGPTDEHFNFPGIDVRRRRTNEPVIDYRSMLSEMENADNFKVGSVPEEIIGQGWSHPEDWGAAGTIRWSVTQHAVLYWPRQQTSGDELVLRAMAFEWDGATSQSVTIKLNEHDLGTRYLPFGGLQEIHWKTAPDHWKAGYNRLDIHFGYAHSPSKDRPGYTDFRVLAAAVESLRLESAED